MSAPGLVNEPSQSGSFASPTTPKHNVSNFKIRTIKRGFTEEADQLLNCLVLAHVLLALSSHVLPGTWHIRRSGTSVPQKFCVRDLPCELPFPTDSEYPTNFD